MRAPVQQVAYPVVQRWLDPVCGRALEILRPEQLRDGGEFVSKAFGTAYQVYRGLQRAGFIASAVMEDKYGACAITLQAGYLVRVHMVVPARICKIYIYESELLSHERREQVLLYRLLAGASRWRVEEMALVPSSRRYDPGIRDNFLPRLGASLACEPG